MYLLTLCENWDSCTKLQISKLLQNLWAGNLCWYIKFTKPGGRGQDIFAKHWVFPKFDGNYICKNSVFGRGIFCLGCHKFAKTWGGGTYLQRNDFLQNVMGGSASKNFIETGRGETFYKIWVFAKFVWARYFCEHRVCHFIEIIVLFPGSQIKWNSKDHFLVPDHFYFDLFGLAGA